MYTNFFGLTEKPFTITPDPRYLFMSERHAEALAHLVYGITESGGFIQLTGEVGTGKTTLVRSLLQQLPAEVDIALVLNPQLSALEFLSAICGELGIPTSDKEHSRKALVDALNQYLLSAHGRGRRTILVVDEAQNLAAEVLEQIRMLTNLETAKQKLLQVILIGQPELRDLLARNDLRQLAQRITGRYHLEPLSRDESEQYIEHRLKIAGGVGELFTQGAKREIFRLSGGIPRIMNVICDRCLLGAYTRESRTIDKALVQRAAAEVSGQDPSPAWLRWLVPVLSVAGIFVVIAGLWALLQDRPAKALSTPVVSIPIDKPIPLAKSGSSLVSNAAANTSTTGASLDELLIQNRASTGTDAAFTNLLALWNSSFDVRAGSACAQARQQALSCLFQRGSWNGIRQLDRPAILTLTDSEGDKHQVVLVGLNENRAELIFGEQRTIHSLDEISNLWFGEFLLLWRPPNGEIKAYRQGVRDAGVLWIRQSLAAIDPDYISSPADSDLFDKALEEKIREFQRDRRLSVDGLVGKQTQIVINTALGLDDIPRLRTSL